MQKVGKAIRNAYHWVPTNHPIFLFLDNAGSHGMQDIVDAYVKGLEDDFNVICTHQRPCGPVINMLDLRVWMAFQKMVEKLHLRQRTEVKALANTVNKAWDELEPIKLENVYNQWKMVLELIIEDKGGDGKIESKRSKLCRAPSEEAKCMDGDDTTETDDIGEIEAEAD